MEVDWLNIQQQNGEAGTTTIQFNTLMVNEGLDREINIRAVCGDASSIVNIKQAGKREIFNCADGNFRLSNGETFNVLKITK